MLATLWYIIIIHLNVWLVPLSLWLWCRANRKIDKIATGNTNPALSARNPGLLFSLFSFPLDFSATYPTIEQIAPGEQYCIAKNMFWLNNIFTWTGWTILYCEAKLQSAWLPDRQEGGGLPVQPTLHLVQRAALQRNIVWRCNLSALWEQGGSKGSSQQVEIHFTLFCTEHTCGSTAQNVIYCGRWGSMVPIVDQPSSSPDIMISPGDLEGDWAHQGKGLFGLRQIARMPIWRSTSWQNE